MEKILVVDDASFIRMRYSRSLQNSGYHVEEASNGAEALEKYRLSRPDGVLLDINMPVMDGMVALQEILNLDPSARVAMVSSIGSTAIISNALRSGARDFVTKPTENGCIVHTVQRLLS